MDEELIERLERLAGRFERMHFEEYLRYIENRKRYFFVNFLLGVARGLGSVVGFTILGGVLIVVLQQIVTDNVPLIGNFLAKVIQVVQERM